MFLFSSLCSLKCSINIPQRFTFVNTFFKFFSNFKFSRKKSDYYCNISALAGNNIFVPIIYMKGNFMDSSKSVAYNPTENTPDTATVRSGYSFYQKIFFLYFLNLIDWLCTEALLASGKFYEANPVMQPVLTGFWQTILIKGIFPLALILICCLVFRLLGEEQSLITNILLYIGIIAYALVNLWHIFNFVLLFSGF